MTVSTRLHASKLPEGLPLEITVVLRQGMFKGDRQYWAPYTHKGKQHKLVMDIRRRAVSLCGGEEWIVWPTESPNGHIIFCSPQILLKTENGEYALVERTKRYVDRGCDVSIHKHRDPERIGWWRRGTLKSVVVENDTLKIAVTDATHEYQERHSRAQKISDFVFEAPIRECRHGYGNHSGYHMSVHIGGTQYEVWFQSSVRPKYE